MDLLAHADQARRVRHVDSVRLHARSAPAAANRVAIDFPMPDAPPVMSARFPRSVFTRRV
jgi:hypothetical protein